jgi:hypothetical protein
MSSLSKPGGKGPSEVSSGLTSTPSDTSSGTFSNNPDSSRRDSTVPREDILETMHLRKKTSEHEEEEEKKEERKTPSLLLFYRAS